MQNRGAERGLLSDLQRENRTLTLKNNLVSHSERTQLHSLGEAGLLFLAMDGFTAVPTLFLLCWTAGGLVKVVVTIYLHLLANHNF